jgi:hypothetical protein
MDIIGLLLEPAILFFTVPILLAVLFWLTGLIGLVDFEALDLEPGADVGFGSGTLSNLSSLAGFGLIPLSLFISLSLFCFGWSGIALYAFIGTDLLTTGWSYLGTNFLIIPSSIVVSVGLTAGAVRLLRPLFSDYGKASDAYDLIGKVAVVKSGTVSPDFGEAIVQLKGGIKVEIATRTDNDANNLRYGDQALILDYDLAQNTYLVERYEDFVDSSGMIS